MATLLLCLAGPLQAWGVQSLYEVRDSDREPSKSGVIGLLCAALGRPRWEPVADLAALRFGVRADREGRLATDYQTLQTINARGEVRETGVSRRYYLADAVFLAGLEGDLALLASLAAALRQPRWSLYLGRKAFVPSRPVWLADGLREGVTLDEALATYPWQGGRGEPPARLRVVLDCLDGERVVADVPVSFAERLFASRRTRTSFLANPTVREVV